MKHQINKSTLEKLKAKLGKLGHGSKTQLAQEVGMNRAQISRMLRLGYVPGKYQEKLFNFINK